MPERGPGEFSDGLRSEASADHDADDFTPDDMPQPVATFIIDHLFAQFAGLLRHATPPNARSPGSAVLPRASSRRCWRRSARTAGIMGRHSGRG